MNNEEQLLSMLQIHVQGESETNVRMEKLEAGQNVTNTHIEKLAAALADISEMSDSLEAKVMRLEAGQILVYQKLDALAAENTRILECLNKIAEDIRQQRKYVNSEIEDLSGIVKDNTFNIVRLKQKIS